MCENEYAYIPVHPRQAREKFRRLMGIGEDQPITKDMLEDWAVDTVAVKINENREKVIEWILEDSKPSCEEPEELKTDNKIISAHSLSLNNRPLLEGSGKCGCFHCLKIFLPSEITEWQPDSPETAVCPHCGIDSVIGESSDYPITTEFLAEMNNYWF